MQRVFPLIWLLVLGLAGAHLASVVALGTPCCRGETSRSDNCCVVVQVASDAPGGAEASRAGHSSCCASHGPLPAETGPESPQDKPHDHDRHPCTCPAQCCVVGKAPVSFTVLPSFEASSGHAPVLAHEWREPLPNPTLDRLKRPPRPRATV